MPAGTGGFQAATGGSAARPGPSLTQAISPQGGAGSLGHILGRESAGSFFIVRSCKEQRTWDTLVFTIAAPRSPLHRAFPLAEKGQDAATSGSLDQRRPFWGGSGGQGAVSPSLLPTPTPGVWEPCTQGPELGFPVHGACGRCWRLAGFGTQRNPTAARAGAATGSSFLRSMAGPEL